jgi:F0F1-type ATP synthase membrane subunit b/b'
VNFSLTPVVSRALALAVLFGMLLLVWFVVASPLIDLLSERKSEIETLQRRSVSLKATIARIPELERRGRAAKAALDAAGSIWIGASDAAIAASLQDQLRQAVAKSDGTVKSTSYLGGATTDKDLQTIRIRLSADGTLETLQQTLAAVEAARPPMFVESMMITAPAQFTTDKPPILALGFEISAFMRKA